MNRDLNAFGGRRERTFRVALIVAGVTQLVCPLLLIVFLIGSLLLTGGQVTPDSSPKWDRVVPWPLFTVNPWIPIIAGVVAVPVTAVLATTGGMSQLGAQTSVLAWMTATAIAASGFAGLFSESSLTGGDTAIDGWGDHFFGALGALAGVLILTVRVLPLGLLHGRLRKRNVLAYPQLTPPLRMRRDLLFAIEFPPRWIQTDGISREDWNAAVASHDRIPRPTGVADPRPPRRRALLVRVLGEPARAVTAPRAPAHSARFEPDVDSPAMRVDVELQQPATHGNDTASMAGGEWFEVAGIAVRRDVVERPSHGLDSPDSTTHDLARRIRYHFDAPAPGASTAAVTVAIAAGIADRGDAKRAVDDTADAIAASFRWN